MLTLQGTEEEVGSYACRWSNYLGQSFKNFTVTFAEEPDDIGNTVVIAVGTLTVVIILASILIGIRLYLDKVDCVWVTLSFILICDRLNRKATCFRALKLCSKANQRN